MGNVFSISIPCDAIFSRCLDCTCRKAKYLRQLEDNLDDLKNSLEDLVQARNDVMMRVTIAEQQRMKRLHKVQLWLTRVQAVEIEVGELQNVRSHEIEKLCLAGYCSKNCKSSYKFGKKVVKKLQVVAALKDEGNFKDVAERVPEDSVEERPIETTIMGLQSTFNLVWRCIEEEHVGVIGLYGMGGVGKTTLLTQINNNFLETPNDFDIVIWVVVSKDLRLEKIQEDIGKRLDLYNDLWTKKSLGEKATEIFKILSKKNFVLLLDDIWDRVDLTKVGIPPPNPKIVSKVIFTTRFIDVCASMEADMKFKVECLSHDKAWELFQTKVGKETIDSHPNIPKLAEAVAQECAGLPLALITVGRAMAFKKTPEEWNYAIQVLRRSAAEFPGMGKEVYPLLKFSYDNLPSDTIRSCILYCSLFSEDYSIFKWDLIDCWIGERFLDTYDESGGQNQGYHIIGVLLHACLLEEVDNYRVKLHDVIRDMTLWIACEIEREKRKFLVYAGAGLTEVPKVEKWEGIERISLMENQIQNLSRSPTCPHLITLFLNNNNLTLIRNGFFQFMHSLRVLNLSSNPSLSELPLGISKLVSLQHLNLSRTIIRELPEELKTLVNLKCLNLEHTSRLRRIPRQLISNLLMLHVLRMYFCGLSEVGGNSIELVVEELLGLKHLSLLTITLTNARALQRFLSSHKLQNCTRSLSLERFLDSKSLNAMSLADMNHLEVLCIIDCANLEELKIDCPGKLQMVGKTRGFLSLQIVDIFDCLKLREVTWLILAPNLKIIQVDSCFDLEEIISVEKLGKVSEMIRNQTPFENLQFFTVRNLPNLRSIYPSTLPFPHLKEMCIHKCPKLKKLPLDSSSAKEHKIVIRGKEDWWKELQWEDQTTQNSFLPHFSAI